MDISSALWPLLWPLVRCLDPERAHGLALTALRLGMVPRPAKIDDPCLRSTVWGRDFSNPVGLAAGFDKDGQVTHAMLAQGFGFVEVGSLTPQPQPGNPRPRLFRLTADRAVINRMGFNSAGVAVVAANLAPRRDRAGRHGIVGINLGKNKTSDDAARDYAEGVRHVAPLADYLVVNVSSPNTPGLRALQSKQALSDLLGHVREARDLTVPEAPPPLLLKIAPDLTDQDLRDIAEVARTCALDGLICTNTTIARPEGLHDPQCNETGGLSGRPLRQAATRILAEVFRLTEGRIPLIGVGGVENGETAYEKIRAGASLVQLYSALVYRGPALAACINRELAALLRRDGYANISEAVGADSRSPHVNP